MHYKKNFLTNVILRLDFNNVDALIEDMGQGNFKFSEDIKTAYPIIVPRKYINASVSISQEAMSQSRNEALFITYKNDQEGKKNITLMPNALVFEYKQSQYQNFNSFFYDIGFIFEKFQENYSLPEFNRLGLRYINEIQLPGGDPLNWEGYLNQNLVCAIKAGIIKDVRITRSMHQLHLIKEDILIVFNYGLYNKNYPNPVLLPIAVLDYDCYVPTTLVEGDVLNSIKKLNKIAEEMFENSIEQSLRDLMESV